jgi:hypothetical protein
MRSRQGWNSWTLAQIAPGVSSEQIRTARARGARAFFFQDARSLAANIRRVIGAEGTEPVVAEAEQILAGDLPFFGAISFPCEFPPQWFRNPATGQSVSPEMPWTKMRFASREYGDLKFILEPSRFLFVYPLLRAYALTGDERFPAAFWRAIEDWADQSPPMTGPLWVCGQECALRILAWSFALYSFIDSPSGTHDRVALLISMIAAHAWRIAQTVGYARSQRSNHLISEAVGLWTAGTLYPELRKARDWQALGAELLRESVLDQITPTGVSQQHSFNYQRMILHQLLWVLRLAEIYHVPIGTQVRERIEAAFDFIRGWVDPVSGTVPNYGSNDGTLLFPLAPTGYGDFRPLLQLGAAVLQRPRIKAGPWDEAVVWFGLSSARKEKSLKEKSTENSYDHPQASVDTGYFRLGDQSSWALIRAGRYTRRPFQADQLHLDLWWHGINLARDAGTYLYNGNLSSGDAWNNGFAGTNVHNTVTIDHCDQMQRAGRFLWINWAQASGRICSSADGNGAERFEGEHNGYLRLSVVHRRIVQWLGGIGWLIVDEILGTGTHTARLHWLLGDLPSELSDSRFEVELAAANALIRWNLFASAPATGALIRAGRRIATISNTVSGRKSDPPFAIADEQQLGWESPTYGSLEPALSLIYEVSSRLPVRFVTAVLTEKRCRIESTKSEVAILRDDEEICRASLEPSGKLPAVTFSPVGVPTP